MRWSGCFRTSALAAVVLALAAAGTVGAADTLDDFEGGGTPATIIQAGSTPGATVMGGGPSGNFLRLATTAIGQGNYYAYDQTATGFSQTVTAEFDFRNGTSVASDGFGFALLNVANFGASGPAGGFLSEEPNAIGSLGVGLDNYNNGGAAEGNNNHCSLHFNGQWLASRDLTPFGFRIWRNSLPVTAAFDHIKIEANLLTGTVSVYITPAGMATFTVFDNFPVPNLAPYAWRGYISARTGGGASLHDIDNFKITATDLPQFPPSARPDGYGTSPNQQIFVPAPGVLANDRDLNGDFLTASLVTDVSHGTLTLNTNGSFTYLPAADFSGTDSFSYRAADGQGGSGDAVVTITVSTLPVSNLLLRYSFDEGAGTTSNDSSGFELHGTLLNGTAWANGVSGTAVSFDGVNDSVECPAFSFAANNAITVSYWNLVTSSQIQDASAFSIGQGDTGGANRIQAHSPFTDRKISFDYGNDTTGRVSTDYSPFIDKWTHITLVASGTTGLFQAIYLNGTLAASKVSTVGPGTKSGLRIGYFSQPGFTWRHRGAIDDFRIYNRMLSEVEIAQLAKAFPTTTAVTGVFTTNYRTTPQNLALTATVSGAAPVTEGSVSFQLMNGATPVSSAILASVTNGIASGTYVLPALTPAGTYTIQASFSGSAAFAGSADSAHTLSVELAPAVTAAVDSAIGSSAGEQPVVLKANVTSPAGTVNEGTVTFNVKNGAADLGTPVLGSVSNGSASGTFTIPGGTPAGTYTIEAGFSGTNFSASSDDSHALTIGAPNTTTAKSATLSYRVASQDVTLYATVTGTTGAVNEGTVTFQIKDGATNIGASTVSPTVSDGVASVAYTIPAGTPAGTYSIFASYSGGPSTPSSSDNTKTVTITRAATDIVLANATVPYSFAEQTVALNFQVTSSAGVVNDGTLTVQLKFAEQDVGAAVTSSQIAAGTAAVNYVIPAGTAQGVYSIQATYNGTVNFATSGDQAHTLTILKATAVLTWASPAEITYGAALDSTQLNASVGGTPGTLDYDPPAGTVLTAGNTQLLSVTFTPADTVNYNVVQKNVSIDVKKKALTVAADNQSKLFGIPNPPLTASFDGFANDETQLVLAGSPALSTTANTSSAVGNYPITITAGTLTSSNYSFVFINGALTIADQPAFLSLNAPIISFGTPSTVLGGAVTYGTPGTVDIVLNGDSRSVTIDAAARFSAAFDTSALEPGGYSIDYSYPGSGPYNPISAARALTVVKGQPEITWNNPGDIEYQTALSSAQLNATASVPGTFSYDPPAGTVLSVGMHTLSTIFIPTDSNRYISSSASVTLNVLRATPQLDWPTPDPITYGTELSATQLNATTDIAGTFAYTPPSGTALNAGAAQELKVTFQPDDSANFAASTTSVFIDVLKADQSITFAEIADQEIGTEPLTLSATATSNLPVTISVISGNATLQGFVLTLAGLGPVTLRAVQAGDGNYNAAPIIEQTFSVVVIPPHLTNVLTASGTQGQAFSFVLAASGTKPVSFETSTLPPGLSLNGSSGEISGTPTASGAFQIAITARNGAGSDSKVLTLVILSSSGNQNHAPRFTSGIAAAPNPAAVNQEVVFGAPATDADGDAIAIVWDFGDGLQGFGPSAAHRYAAAGIFVAKATITDGVASDYLNLTVVVNATVIPPDQLRLFVVSKLALKFNFAKPNADSLSISGTIPVPQQFAADGKTVSFESGDLRRDWSLDKKATSADKAFKLSGKLAKDGTFSASPAKFALGLKNQALFAALKPLGFANDNTPKGMIVKMPVIFIVEGTGYLATIDVKYAAKKSKSGSGKK